MADERLRDKHKIIMDNRENVHITGVLDVLSFDEDMIVTDTPFGILEIKGNELHVNKLNLENGELSIEGNILSMIYFNSGHFSKTRGGFLEKIFK